MDVNYIIGKGEAKELTCRTHEHELSEEIARGKGIPSVVGQKGKILGQL